MTGTLNTIGTLLLIRTSSAANRLIFYARKLPLVGGAIPESAYSSLTAKKALAVAAFVLSTLWGFVAALLYLGLLVYLPVVSLAEAQPQTERLQLFLHIFLLQGVIAAGVTSATVLETKKEKYIAVKLMRLQPGRYMRAAFSYRYVAFFLHYVLALLIFAMPLGASAVQALALAAAVTLWRVLCEYAHLKLFERTGGVLIRNNPVVWLTIALAYAAAYLPLLAEEAPLFGSVLLSVPVWLIMSAAGIYGAFRLARYPDYRAAVDAASKRDDPLLNLGKMMADAHKSEVRTKDRDLAAGLGRSGRTEGKEGHAYLNEIFFARHRSLVREPVYKRLALIGALGVAGAGFGWLGGESAVFLQKDIGFVLPFLALVLNFLSVGEKVCRALFYNCDLSLLRYGFYRRDAIKHFRIRLVRIAGYNLLVAAALGAALTLVSLSATGGVADAGDLLLLWVSVLSLSVFFSVHHLFMYYFFQPYSTELNMKNPLFFVVNFVVSAACGLGIALDAKGSVFAAIVVLLTVAYAALALTVVRRTGANRFRVK